MRHRGSWTLLGLAMVACSPGSVGEAVRPEAPTASEALDGREDGVACRAVARAEPLIVDWKSNDRVDLELAMKEGVALVNYDCESLRLVKGCKVRGSYAFAGVTRKEDVVQITNRDELAANLPFSSGSLGGEVSRGQSIDLALVLVGKKGTTVTAVAKPELQGSCEGATHFVRAAFVGGFAMASGSTGSTKAVAEMFGVGARASSTSEKSTANKDGDLKACRTSSPSADNPPEQCQSAIRLELVPIVDDIDTKVKNATAKEEEAVGCPEGMVQAGLKCTTSTASVAHECDHTNTAECVAQCELGDQPSCVIVGHRHLQGKDLPRDQDKALALFKKACEAGIANGCFEAGSVYMQIRQERGISEDKATEARINAQTWYDKACQAGNGWMCWNVSDWYLREGVLEIFPRDPARAMSMLRRGCDLGYGPSCLTLAQHMLAGKETKKDVPGAVSLMQRACDGGRWEDCEMLGNTYRDGVGLTRNPVLAIAAYTRACELTGARACHSAGALYAEGDGVPKDLAKARELFALGCRDGVRGWDACKSLGEALEKGLGGAKDPAKAAEAYEAGCMKGGCLRAGTIWERGLGVDADMDKALAAYTKGCQRAGDEQACEGRGRVLERTNKVEAQTFYAAKCEQTKSPKWCAASRRVGNPASQ